MRIVAVLALVLAALPLAQSQAPAAPRVRGEVTAVDAAQRRLTIKGDDGATVTVTFAESTRLLRLPPGETTLTKATPLAATELAAGDRVLAVGTAGADWATTPARQVIVMTKADIAKKHEADRAEWSRRGVFGTVAAVAPDRNEVTVNVRGRDGQTPVVVAVKPDASIRRYAPDSVRFSDAQPSTLAAVRVGDQLRARGNRSEDGARFTAEELVSGTFRNVAGTVLSVNAASGEIQLRDLATNRPVTVKLSADTTLRRVPPMMATMLANNRGGAVGGGMAMRGGPGGPAASASPGSGSPADGPPRRPDNTVGDPGERGAGGPGARPQGMASAGPRCPGMMGGPGMGGPGGMMGGPGGLGMSPGRGNFDIAQALERLPALNASELKAGDALIVASTAGADTARLNAITVLAGVEPLLTAPAETRSQVLGGSWTLDVGMVPMQ